MSGEPGTVKGAFRKTVRIDADEERAFVLHGGKVVMLMEPYEGMTARQWQAMVDYVASGLGATPVVDDVARHV